MPDLSEEQFATVVAATRQAGAAWIFGTAYGRLVDGKPEHYNAAILVGPGGQVEERYHKQRLVIFGEFIPFENILPFMKWLTPIGSSFTPGRGPAAFRFGTNRSVNASPMICFEDVFPHHTRSHVTPETDFLLELTNNGWFGESSAQWQHCAAAALRAVENGVPLVRCANNGLTCWLDEFGGLHDVLQSASGSVYDAGFLSTRVPLRPDGEPRPLTFYNRHGDVFGWLCFAAMIIGTASTFRR
jgi:apolipoprotein N-acyltransferase